MNVTDATRVAFGGSISAVLTMDRVHVAVGIAVGVVTLIYLCFCIRVKAQELRRGKDDR